MASTSTTPCRRLYPASASSTSWTRSSTLHRRAGLELHCRHRHLPGARVGQSEHRAVDNRGVTVQYRLDLCGGDLEPAHLDHLLAAVGQMDPTFGFEPADVARPVPAVGKGPRSRVIGQVAGHGRPALHLDLAHLSRREHGAGVEVDRSESDIADGQTGRVQTPDIRSGDGVGRDHRDLAGTVRWQPAHTRARRDRLGNRRRHGRRPPHDVAERGQVEVLQVLMVGHGQRDGRDRHLEGHPLRLDEVQLLVEVETPM